MANCKSRTALVFNVIEDSNIEVCRARRINLLFAKVNLKLQFKTVDIKTCTLIIGLVEPPMKTIVKRTITSVVLTKTFLISSSNGKCSAKANAIAPRNPESMRKFSEIVEIEWTGLYAH